MKIFENVSLKDYNTFNIDVKADFFVSVSTIEELKYCLSTKPEQNKIIIGGGSNILFTKPFKGLVIHLNLKGINIISKNNNQAIVNAAAGENWHNFVSWTLSEDLGGLENLSYIPGNVGTAPIQNIGAYGVELKDHFHKLTALNVETLVLETFHAVDCKFGYRDSIFKNVFKGKYIICEVSFKLTAENHQIRTNYGSIGDELEKMEVNAPTIQEVSRAVIQIRKSKLPDPKKIGNSGSFFKNPIISCSKYKLLLKNFPELPSYPYATNKVKIPAAWLIEKAGFKGKTFENYGVHKKQALVLVNYGNAKGADILRLSKLIQLTIFKIFEVKLETEVNIL